METIDHAILLGAVVMTLSIVLGVFSAVFTPIFMAPRKVLGRVGHRLDHNKHP